MNAFYEHHQDNIKFSYRCFDRLLLNGCIQSFLDGARQYHNWVEHNAQKWGVEIVEDPEGRRDDFVEPYFGKAQLDQVVVIIKAREPAGIGFEVVVFT